MLWSYLHSLTFDDNMIRNDKLKEPTDKKFGLINSTRWKPSTTAWQPFSYSIQYKPLYFIAYCLFKMDWNPSMYQIWDNKSSNQHISVWDYFGPESSFIAGTCFIMVYSKYPFSIFETQYWIDLKNWISILCEGMLKCTKSGMPAVC